MMLRALIAWGVLGSLQYELYSTACHFNTGKLELSGNWSCNCRFRDPPPSFGSVCHNSNSEFINKFESSAASHCELKDPCNRLKSKKTPHHKYHFIIIGGGSAGAVVANRLSANRKWKILLIEAGEDEPTGTQIPSLFSNYFGSEIDWNMKTEPETDACLNNCGQRCAAPRGKVLGGTSVIHGMMYMRGSVTDYDNWAALGNTGWSYQDVLPFFLISEDNLQVHTMDAGYHATGGYLSVTQFPYTPPIAYDILTAASDMGYEVRDLNGQVHTGFMIAQTNSKNGARVSSAKAFLRPIKDRNNLHILLNATVTKILIDPQKQLAYGVAVIHNGASKEIYARNEIIVSAGAYNSPKILLQSGVGPKQDLEALNIPVMLDLPGVGQNLQNHVSYGLQFLMNEFNTAMLNQETADEYIQSLQGPLASTGLAQLTGIVHTKYANKNIDHPDLQFYFKGYLADCASTMETRSSGNRVITVSPTYLQAKSRGYITLRSSDPSDPPLIYARYLTEEDDINGLINGIEMAIALFQADALKSYDLQLNTTQVRGCEHFDFGSYEYWRCAVRRDTGAQHHQTSSCKMGPSTDYLAVVDPELRVHGLPNVRVADNSIMPVITSGNTYAPAVMIGERAADFIQKYWSDASDS